MTNAIFNYFTANVVLLQILLRLQKLEKMAATQNLQTNLRTNTPKRQIKSLFLLKFVPSDTNHIVFSVHLDKRFRG